MRITAESKTQTRNRIIQCALRLFERHGFHETSTRDLADCAGIATGTLFNYFHTKEALGLSIMETSLEGARTEFNARVRGSESLEELLFAYLAIELRHLRPYRAFVIDVFESTLSPSTGASEGEQIRQGHLEYLRALIVERGAITNANISFVTLHLYWTMYLGILAFWAKDESRHQEDTLALLDQSMRLFVASLSSNPAKQEMSHDA